MNLEELGIRQASGLIDELKERLATNAQQGRMAGVR